MAFSGEAEVLVWQRVNAQIAGASPGAQLVFRALQRWMTQHKLCPNLQFVTFDSVTNASGGTNAAVVICGGAATLYGFYAKKSTGVVLSYPSISNHATAIQAQKEVLLSGTAAAVEVTATYLTGLAFSTGLTYSAVTAYNGTTRSLLADSWDGFAIIGV